MKIGIDCHNLETQRTGVGRYLWNLLSEWSKMDLLRKHNDRDNCIQFFLYFKNAIPKDIQALFSMRSGTSRMRNLHGKSNALFKHWLLPRAARRDKVDVLFCPDYVLPFYVGNVGYRKPHTKTAVTIHDIIYEARPQEYSWPSLADKILLKWASKQSAKKADIILVPSEFTRSEILKYHNADSAKVVVIPLAADPKFTKIDMPGEKPTEELRVGVLGDWQRIRQEYRIEDAFVLFVGSIFNRRFLPQKIEAFTEFGKECPNYQFLIVGKNHTKPFQDIAALVAAANQRLGREAVIWKEYVSDDDLVYLYNGAFATLWLSSYEGFGLPVLESMACGTPVITSISGSLPEVARDAAIYVAHPENADETASALAHLVRYEQYRSELIAKGLARAAQFSWHKTAIDTLESIIRV